jgi:CHAT domain-containing protein/Tfp pilus assembly protein PilF
MKSRLPLLLISALLLPAALHAGTTASLETQLEESVRQHGSASDAAGELHIQLGDALMSANRPKDALEHYVAAVIILTERMTDGHPLVRKLAEAMSQSGSEDEEAMLSLFASASEEHLGTAHELTASSLLNLADHRATQGRSGEAEAGYLKSLEVAERAVGPKHLKLVAIQNKLIDFYMATERVSDAASVAMHRFAVVEENLGPSHPDTNGYLAQLLQIIELTPDPLEAESLYRHSIALIEATSGKNDVRLVGFFDRLIALYVPQRRNAHIAELSERSLRILQQKFGADHPALNPRREALAAVYNMLGKYSEAAELGRQTIRILEAAGRSDDPSVALAIVRHWQRAAGVSSAQEGEALLRRALSIIDSELGPDDPNAAEALVGLALIVEKRGQLAETEQMLRRALAIQEAKLGYDDQRVVFTVGNLAGFYARRGRHAEAEQLRLRALRVSESSFGLDSVFTALQLSNLGMMYLQQSRYAEAEPVFARALTVIEANGETSHPHPLLPNVLDGYGSTLAQMGKFEPSELALKRALEARKKLYGSDRATFNSTYFELGNLYLATQRPAEAEAYLQDAFALSEDMAPLVKTANALSRFLLDRGRVAEAMNVTRKAFEAIRDDPVDSLAPATAPLRVEEDRKEILLRHIELVANGQEGSANNRQQLSNAFEAFQLAQRSSTAGVVGLMAARFAAGQDSLAKAIRDMQDTLADIMQAETRLNTLISADSRLRNREAEDALRQAIQTLKVRLRKGEGELATRFPAYAELSSPRPQGIDATEKALRHDEALLAYTLGEKGAWLFVVRNGETRLLRLEAGREAIESSVQFLRQRLGQEVYDPDRLRPYDATEAHDLYAKIFRPAEAYLTGVSRVMLVLDGALHSLPFSTLVTDPPAEKIRSPQDHRKIAWLGQRYAFTTLPSVSSLRTLRAAAPLHKEGIQPFAGFGDPVLKGRQGAEGARRNLTIGSLFGAYSERANVEAIRELPPLPDTAEELTAIGKALRAGHKALYLRDRATETNVKQAALDRTRVIAFSTHGVMAGELQGYAEPGLILTPPGKGSDLDDGYLSTSEIAQLKLNAEWVLLSACNTAANDGKPAAEGLSGLAKAFFYAGTRSLLVSHWPVDSVATRQLITNLLSIYASTPEMSKGDALRQASLSLMNDAQHPHFAHPLYWAPFVVAGDD